MTTVPSGALMASVSWPKRSIILSWVVVESISGMEKLGFGALAKPAVSPAMATKTMSQKARKGHTLR